MLVVVVLFLWQILCVIILIYVTFRFQSIYIVISASFKDNIF